MNFTDLVTARLNRMIPQRAVTWRTTDKGIEYLHPTKGWKRISYKRLGVKPSGV